MHRIPLIQSLCKATIENRKIGQPTLILTPVYYSIYGNNSVRDTDDIVKSIVGNPLYIMCFIIVPKTHFNGVPYKELVHYATLDRSGDIISSIKFGNWELIDFKFSDIYGTLNQLSLSLEECIFDYSFSNYNLNNNANITLSKALDLVKAISLNCNTVKEAELYSMYLLKKIELDNNIMTLEEYKSEIDASRDLIIQYADLLRDIHKLIKDK